MCLYLRRNTHKFQHEMIEKLYISQWKEQKQRQIFDWGNQTWIRMDCCSIISRTSGSDGTIRWLSD